MSRQSHPEYCERGTRWWSDRRMDDRHKMIFENWEGKWPLWRTALRTGDNFKMDVKLIAWDGVMAWPKVETFSLLAKRLSVFLQGLFSMEWVYFILIITWLALLSSFRAAYVFVDINCISVESDRSDWGRQPSCGVVQLLASRCCGLPAASSTAITSALYDPAPSY
jgi:hypothetical protein